jgi:hypothetical protein
MGRTVAGVVSQWETPNWRPLEELVGLDLIRQFMWLFTIQLEDGTELEAYKHIDTRRYLHLADDGRAFYYCADGRYWAVERDAALAALFEGWDARAGRRARREVQ